MKKGSRMTEEQKQKISKSNKKTFTNPELRKRISEALKGKHPSEESKRKQKESLRKAWLSQELRKRQSELTKKGMSNPGVKEKLIKSYERRKGIHFSPQTEFKKGLIPWNLGKPQSKDAKEKNRLAHLGKPSGRKGQHASEKTIRKLIESHKGKHASEETRKKMSLAQKTGTGLIRNRESMLRRYESGSFPKQENTKPERQTKEELIKRGYKEGTDFIHQYRFMDKFMCDFCFPNQKVIVEVYGDFWHANPAKYAGKQLHKHQLKDVARDKSKEAYIKKVDNGSWTYLVIWESDIKKDVSKCVDKIKEVLTKKIT